MSRGPGRVMREVEAHLTTLPLGGYTAWVSYNELAQVVYRVDTPTRAQLSAIGRAVGRLVNQGKARRRLTGYLTEEEWSRPVPADWRRRGYWRGQPGMRRGFGVRRETLVARATGAQPGQNT